MHATWVLLTQGDRSDELEVAVRSIEAAAEEGDEIVLVGNGCAVPDFGGIRGVELPENVGIPAGRNRGVQEAAGELVCFLDDDARLLDADFTSRLKTLFAAEPKLGIVSFRITDSESGTSQRRHVPRIGNVDPERSSAATTFLGGACAIRAEVFDNVGRFPEEFFYALEETDLAWRALDAGWTIRYESSFAVNHPSTEPGRHPDYLRRTARNRVWLARRRLPGPLAFVYVLDWLILSLARSRSLADIRQNLAGTSEGLRTDAGERDPMRWRTALAMARAGRPPII